MNNYNAERTGLDNGDKAQKLDEKGNRRIMNNADKKE